MVDGPEPAELDAETNAGPPGAEPVARAAEAVAPASEPVARAAEPVAPAAEPVAPVAEPSTPETVASFESAAEEGDYQVASRMLVDPPPSQQKTQLLVFTLLGFVAATFAQDATKSVIELALLVGVLFVHELGHVVGMRLFGYRDVKMFFIPFFGAAASGRKRGVARWKEGVVLLLGPLPGIIVGCALAYIDGPPLLRTLALTLIGLNALNLLPIAPLDGGQLFSVTLFSRQRHLEVIVLAIAAVVIILAGIAASAWFFMIIGVFMLLSLPQRQRMLAAGHSLRDKGLPADPVQLDDAQRRQLYRTAWNSLTPPLQQKWRGNARPQAEVMEQILERATQKPPSADATAALLGVWFVGLMIAAVGFNAAGPAPVAPAAAPTGPTDPNDPWAAAPAAPAASRWQVYKHEDPHFSVELPGEAKQQHDQAGAGSVTATVGERSYTVTWMAADASWLKAQHDALGGITFEDKRMGPSEYLVAVRRPNAFEVTRLVARGQRGFIVIAIAPTDEIDSRRFVTSFQPD